MQLQTDTKNHAQKLPPKKRRRMSCATVQQHNPSSDPPSPVKAPGRNPEEIEEGARLLDYIVATRPLLSDIEDLPHEVTLPSEDRLQRQYTRLRNTYAELDVLNGSLYRKLSRQEAQYQRLLTKYRRLKSLMGFFGRNMIALGPGDVDEEDGASDECYVPNLPILTAGSDTDPADDSS
ncbi:hypothetical protein H0H93_014079 [Arthromyces matolae]|nr:hypothetical protein H0H93_014079 [Arthromyces matolae]